MPSDWALGETKQHDDEQNITNHVLLNILLCDLRIQRSVGKYAEIILMHKKKEKKLAGDANVIIIIYRKHQMEWDEFSWRLLKEPLFFSNDRFADPEKNVQQFMIFRLRIFFDCVCRKSNLLIYKRLACWKLHKCHESRFSCDLWYEKKNYHFKVEWYLKSNLRLISRFDRLWIYILFTISYKFCTHCWGYF